MKSLSLSRPLMIITIGIPGAGKSFFARKFTDMFNSPLVSYDFLHYTLFPEPQFSREEEALSKDLMFSQVEQLLRTGKTIVIDGGSNDRADRLEYAKLAKEHDYGMVLVWVQTDEASAEYRSTKRSRRRMGDELNSPMDSDTFQSFAKRLHPPQRGEDFVVISGKHTFATQARVVLKKIVAPRAGTIKMQPVKPLQAKRLPTNDIQTTRRTQSIG